MSTRCWSLNDHGIDLPTKMNNPSTTWSYGVSLKKFSKRLLQLSAAALAVSAAVSHSPAALGEETATLRVQFKIKGDAPKGSKITPTVDQAFCGQFGIPDETLVVNPDNKGIANVILYADTGRLGTKLPKVDAEPKTVVLANENCRFQPRVVFVTVGDTLKITNPDKVSHNANMQFLVNTPENPNIPPGGSHETTPASAEPAPIPVSCNIHPWMKAQVVVIDNPYGAASDADGVIEIKGLPAGKVTMRAIHDAGRMSTVYLNGKKTSWRGARWKLELKPGVNDLGVVEVDADVFK